MVIEVAIGVVVVPGSATGSGKRSVKSSVNSSVIGDHSHHSAPIYRQVLVTKRKAEGVLGGYWEFPGGKVEPGESLAACVVREIEEEVGLQVEVVQPLTVIEHTYDHGRVRLNPFLCTLALGVAMTDAQPIEVAAVEWVDGATLQERRLPEANAGLVKEVVGLLA